MNGWFDDFDSLYEMYDNEECSFMVHFVLEMCINCSEWMLT